MWVGFHIPTNLVNAQKSIQNIEFFLDVQVADAYKCQLTLTDKLCPFNEGF